MPKSIRECSFFHCLYEKRHSILASVKMPIGCYSVCGNVYTKTRECMHVNCIITIFAFYIYYFILCCCCCCFWFYFFHFTKTLSIYRGEKYVTYEKNSTQQNRIFEGITLKSNNQQNIYTLRDILYFVC